jgi:hypothetical protein
MVKYIGVGVASSSQLIYWNTEVLTVTAYTGIRNIYSLGQNWLKIKNIFFIEFEGKAVFCFSFFLFMGRAADVVHVTGGVSRD